MFPIILYVLSPQVGLIQQQQQQYRDNHQPTLVNTSCQSPTSPASNPSYSPVASPGIPVGSPSSPAAFPTEAYHYQQPLDTSALQQQFQDINMTQDQSGLVTQAGGIQYHQVKMKCNIHYWVIKKTEKMEWFKDRVWGPVIATSEEFSISDPIENQRDVLTRDISISTL